MSGALAILLLAALQAAPEEERPLESWTCTVGEQLDHNVSGMLQLIVLPDGARREMSFYLNWAQQPGYIALQQARWVWIPLDSERLWKPDDFSLSVEGKRTDAQGAIVFAAPDRTPISESARGKVDSLRPNFPYTHVKIEDGYLIARLWEGWPWTVTLSDRKGVKLGSQAILLPGPEAAQAAFTRLRARLYAAAADPGKNCRANLGQTQRELEEAQIHWGSPIPRP